MTSTHYFNPRPREEGDIENLLTQNDTEHFNPRPREEGDFKLLKSGDTALRISIHALVKRATFGFVLNLI